MENTPKSIFHINALDTRFPTVAATSRAETQEANYYKRKNWRFFETPGKQATIYLIEKSGANLTYKSLQLDKKDPL